jgi:hypothetical protein
MNTIPHTARGLEGVLAYCQLDGKASSARIARAKQEKRRHSAA